MTEHNPQAFPYDEYVREEEEKLIQHKGMTLRDYFAGQMLTKMPLPDFTLTTDKEELRDREIYRMLVAEAVYQMADALLVERAKR